LMVAVAIVAILASIALPAYSSYVQRGRMSDGFEALGTYRMRMEQAFQDNGNYGTAACSVSLPAATTHFTYTCTLSADKQSYVARATGVGAMAGYTYTVDDAGNRATALFRTVAVSANCWLTRPGDC
jgi:type IV pilus assembly protein PilE